MQRLVMTCLGAALLITALTGCQSPNGVGTTYFSIVDEQRFDPYAPVPNTPRDIMVKLWYPADVSNAGEPTHFWYHSQAQALPNPSADFLLERPSNAYLNAPLVAGHWPVVIFSHGYGAPMEQNSLLMTALAKQGNIVVSIGHNHHAMAMTQADGQVTQFDPVARADDFYLSPEADLADPMALNAELAGYAGQPLTPAIIERVYQLTAWAQGDRAMHDEWLADALIATEVLAQLHLGDDQQVAASITDMQRFQGAFDFDELVAIGGSAGGPMALTYCHQVATCLGAINFDGWHFNLERDGEFNKPYLMMRSDTPAPPMIRMLMGEQSAAVYNVRVAGASHTNFSDYSALGDGPYLGTIDGDRMIVLINQAASGFIEWLRADTQQSTEWHTWLAEQPELTVETNFADTP